MYVTVTNPWFYKITKCAAPIPLKISLITGPVYYSIIIGTHSDGAVCWNTGLRAGLSLHPRQRMWVWLLAPAPASSFCASQISKSKNNFLTMHKNWEAEHFFFMFLIFKNCVLNISCFNFFSNQLIRISYTTTVLMILWLWNFISCTSLHLVIAYSSCLLSCWTISIVKLLIG